MDFPREYREIVTSRVRSQRPLVHEWGAVYSIARLRELGLLNNGGGTHAGPELAISTKIAAHKGTCRFQIQKRVYVVALESRPSVCGPSWYFRDSESGSLVKSIFFVGSLAIGRETQGALYASQFQTKAHRNILKLEKLTLAIEGDPAKRKGRARGQSRLKKLALLRRAYNDLRLDQTGKQKAIVAFPQFKTTIRRAGGLLRRELPKLPKGWDNFQSRHQNFVAAS